MTSSNTLFYHAVKVQIQRGKTEDAISDLETFLEENTDDEVALSLYGSALLRGGDLEKALSTFKHAVTLYPNIPGTHTNLAFTAMQAGKNEQAIESYENAVRISPDLYPAWVHLGKLYFEAGNFEAALNAVDRATQLDPLSQEFQQMQTAMQAKNFVEAEEIAHSMLAKRPNHPRAIVYLGLLARNAGAHEERINILSHGLSYHPAHINLRQALIIALEESGKFELAVKHAKLMVKIKPSFMTNWSLSRACGQAGDHAGALSSAESAATYIDANSNELGKVDLLRGHALKILGRRTESEEAYHASIRNTRDNGAGWWALADLKTYQFSDENKQAMEIIIGNETLVKGQRCQAAFALAKAYDHDGHHEQAFHWYQIANDLRPNLRFSPDDNRVLCDTSISEFDADMLATQAVPQPTGPTPIFIVGMPRAGSTLIEQILASHSQIEGTMELMNLSYIERDVKVSGFHKFNKDYPRSLKDLSPEELSTFGQAYLDDTAIFRGSKPFFIDKLPPNFERIGLIHKILPQAIIIDARRHPMDCGFSAYKQHFAGGHGYSYKLEHIGWYFNDYLRLMDHWDDVLPGKVKLVQYEDMVRDTEASVREILAHIGVDFEEACLRFYENKRAVKTASSEQVRQPIYSESIGRWQTVSDQLKPLKNSLGEETMARFQHYL